MTVHKNQIVRYFSSLSYSWVTASLGKHDTEIQSPSFQGHWVRSAPRWKSKKTPQTLTWWLFDGTCEESQWITIKLRSPHTAKLLPEPLVPQQNGQGQKRHGESTSCKFPLAAAEACDDGHVPVLPLHWAFVGSSAGQWRTSTSNCSKIKEPISGNHVCSWSHPGLVIFITDIWSPPTHFEVKGKSVWQVKAVLKSILAETFSWWAVPQKLVFL